jgi:hypothetical protein
MGFRSFFLPLLLRQVDLYPLHWWARTIGGWSEDVAGLLRGRAGGDDATAFRVGEYLSRQPKVARSSQTWAE